MGIVATVLVVEGRRTKGSRAPARGAARGGRGPQSARGYVPQRGRQGERAELVDGRRIEGRPVEMEFFERGELHAAIKCLPVYLRELLRPLSVVSQANAENADASAGVEKRWKAIPFRYIFRVQL